MKKYLYDKKIHYSESGQGILANTFSFFDIYYENGLVKIKSVEKNLNPEMFDRVVDALEGIIDSINEPIDFK